MRLLCRRGVPPGRSVRCVQADPLRRGNFHSSLACSASFGLMYLPLWLAFIMSGQAIDEQPQLLPRLHTADRAGHDTHLPLR